MQGISVIGIGEAANLLERGTAVSVTEAGDMRATRLQTDEGECTLIQGSGEEFFLVK